MILNGSFRPPASPGGARSGLYSVNLIVEPSVLRNNEDRQEIFRTPALPRPCAA